MVADGVESEGLAPWGGVCTGDEGGSRCGGAVVASGLQNASVSLAGALLCIKEGGSRHWALLHAIYEKVCTRRSGNQEESCLPARWVVQVERNLLTKYNERQAARGGNGNHSP